MSDLGTVVSQETVIPAAWVQDVNNWTYRELFNVKRFGAVGNGIVDDTAAIQAAINEAQKVKGWVYFPPVEFAYMVRGLTIGQTGTNYTCHFLGGGMDPSGASQPITGQFTGMSMIKLIDGSNTSLITVNEDAVQPQFKNITFNGNKSGQSGTSYCLNFADVAFVAGRYRYACWMEDCFILDGRSGGIFIGANRGAGMYRNIWVQYCGTTTSDIAVNVRCYDQQFQNLQVGPNAGTGMYVGSATQIQVEGAVFFMNHVNLQIDEGAGTVQFSTCVFDEANTHGVIVVRGTGLGSHGARVFSNCAWQRNSKLATNTYSDILVRGDRRLVLDGCSFVGDFGQGWLPKYNIECDNTLQTTHIRINNHVFESNVGATAATAFTNQYFSLAYTGDRTAYISPWAGANQLSVILNDNEEVRFTPNAMSLVGVAYCDPRYVTPAATNGGTTVMTASQNNAALLPSGSISTHTLQLPPPQADGQIVRISTSQPITTLTVTPTAPATTVFNPTISMAAGQAIAYMYVQGGTAWVRI